MMSPPGPIHAFLAADHARLDALLSRAAGDPGPFDLEAFAEFRSAILRHIGMEEKVLLPAARRASGGKPLPMARRLRVEHGAIAMLLVPTPDREIVGELRSILSAHNVIEEGPEGLYELCDRLLAEDAGEVVARLRGFPRVKLAPHVDGPGVVRSAKDALRISSGRRPAGRTPPGEGRPDRPR